MSIILTNRTRSFKFIGSTRLLQLSVDVTQFAPNQKVLPGLGGTDVVLGTLIQPISSKYPNLGYLRWVDSDGRVQGEERALSFRNSDFIPETEFTAGFELYLRPGTIATVTIANEGGSVNFEDYYTKAEVTALLAAKAGIGDSYSVAASDALLLLKANAASVYTQSQVNALIPTTFRSFDYDQVAVPSSPTNGKTWRERDGSNNIVQDWFYSTAINAWLSLELRSVLGWCSGATATSVISCVGSLVNPSYPVRLIACNTLAYVLTTNNGSNYWTMGVNALGAGTVYVAPQSTISLSPDTPLKLAIALTSTIAYASLTHLALVATKVGTPGNLYSQSTLYYRLQRP